MNYAQMIGYYDGVAPEDTCVHVRQHDVSHDAGRTWHAVTSVSVGEPFTGIRSEDGPSWDSAGTLHSGYSSVYATIYNGKRWVSQAQK